MKLTLEIESNDLKDVLDAIGVLSRFAPTEYTEVLECEDVSKPLLSEPAEEIRNSSEHEIKIKSLEDEIRSLKEIISEYESKKEEINNDIPDLDDLFEDNPINDSSANEELIAEIETLKKELSSVREENESLKESKNDIDLSSYIEKDTHKRIVDNLNKEIELHKGRSDKNFQKNKDLRVSIDNLSREKKELEAKIQDLENNSSNSVEDIEDLKCTIEKLNEEVEFHKNRSDKNFQNLNSTRDELKKLKQEFQELSEKLKENNNNQSNIDIEEMKADFLEQKTRYETQISELKLICDKTKNELTLIRSKTNDEDSKELDELRYIKKTICSNERGKVFWNGIESQVKSKLNSK